MVEGDHLPWTALAAAPNTAAAARRKGPRPVPTSSHRCGAANGSTYRARSRRRLAWAANSHRAGVRPARHRSRGSRTQGQRRSAEGSGTRAGQSWHCASTNRPGLCWNRSTVRSRVANRSEPHHGQIVLAGSRRWWRVGSPGSGQVGAARAGRCLRRSHVRRSRRSAAGASSCRRSACRSGSAPRAHQHDLDGRWAENDCSPQVRSLVDAIPRARPADVSRRTPSPPRARQPTRRPDRRPRLGAAIRRRGSNPGWRARSAWSPPRRAVRFQQ
jgi:hypothetical protein